MGSKCAYPLIDRSDVKFFSDGSNIGFNEGVLSDGRPYRLECWAVDQITNITIFISTIGIEHASSEDVMAFLEAEGLFKVLHGGYGGAALKLTDKNGNEFWSANLVIGDDEDLYATSDVPLKPFNLDYHSEELHHEKSNYNQVQPEELGQVETRHGQRLSRAMVLEAAAERSGINFQGNRNLLDYRKQILPFGKTDLKQVRLMAISDIVEGRWDQDLSKIQPPLTEDEKQKIENYLAEHPELARPKGLSTTKKTSESTPKPSSIQKPKCSEKKYLTEAEVEEAIVLIKRAAKKQTEFVDDINRAIEGTGFELLESETKSIKSALDKVSRRRRAGDREFSIYSLKDHVRAAIKMKSWRDSPVVVKTLQKQFGEMRFQNTLEESNLESGYRGFHVLISMDGGVNGEIQLTVHEAWEIKLQTDSMYKKWFGYQIGYQSNVFLRKLCKLIGLRDFCTISIKNKTEFTNMMAYLGFRIYEGGKQYRDQECYVKSMGWEAYEIFVDLDKCFNEDGTLSELTQNICSPEMLRSDWFDYPEPFE